MILEGKRCGLEEVMRGHSSSGRLLWVWGCVIMNLRHVMLSLVPLLRQVKKKMTKKRRGWPVTICHGWSTCLSTPHWGRQQGEMTGKPPPTAGRNGCRHIADSSYGSNMSMYWRLGKTPMLFYFLFPTNCQQTVSLTTIVPKAFYQVVCFPDL